MAARERTAVLVIRLWLEDGAVRARITRTLDVSAREAVESAAASQEEIVATVRAWLLEFVEDG